MEGKNVLITMLISAAAGAVAGVLFAPDKGSKTRQEISRRSRDFRNMARDEFEDFISETRKYYEEARKEADKWMEKGEAAAKDLKKKIDK